MNQPCPLSVGIDPDLAADGQSDHVAAQLGNGHFGVGLLRLLGRVESGGQPELMSLL
jgi:hypothetical protein